MNSKRIISVVFLAIFFCLIIWLFYKAAQPEIFPIGCLIPKIKYMDANGVHVLKPDSAQNTMVVFFHRKCEHCQYQLKQFNDHFNEFVGVRIFLFTTEIKFLNEKGINNWPILAQSQNINWGIVNGKRFKEKFGSTSTPNLYFFDKTGILFNKIRGEVRLEKIFSILKNEF